MVYVAIKQGDKGIDISHYQTVTDWNKVKADGIKFFYQKATDGTNYTDPTMDSHFRGGTSVGLAGGFYHFQRFHDDNSALAEAKYFVNKIRKYNFTLPPALDLETSSFSSASAMLSAAKTFCRYVEKELGSCIVYMPLEKYRAIKSITSEFGFWFAYPSSNIGGGLRLSNLYAWQHSWKGRVNGISGDVDLDYAGGNFFIVKNKAYGKAAPEPKSEPKKESHSKSTSKVSVPSSYTVKYGDTLSEICAKYGLSVDAIAKLNHIDKDVIYVGQVLKLKGSAPTAKYHKVVAGDTVSELAAKYGSTSAQIKAWNKLDKNYTIYAGETIRVK